MTSGLDPVDLERRLLALGARVHPGRHPFLSLLLRGALNRGQLQAWALNRSCQLAAAARRDATLLGRLEARGVRGAWVRRILDPGASGDDPGSLERWLQLTDALGLRRARVTAMKGVLPSVRFSVAALDAFVAERSLAEAIAAVLAGRFADLSDRAVDDLLSRYDLDLGTAATRRSTHPRPASGDLAVALAFVAEESRSPEQQRGVQQALRFAASIVSVRLDALHAAYVDPGTIPLGAYVPNDARWR